MKNIDKLINQWGIEQRGKGSFITTNNKDTISIVNTIIDKMTAKNDGIRFFIAVSEFDFRNSIKPHLYNSSLNADRGFILTHKYVKETANFQFDVIIVIDSDDEKLPLYVRLADKSKFCLFVFKDIIPSAEMNVALAKIAPIVNPNEKRDAYVDRVNRPVREVRHGVRFPDNVQTEFDEADRFIKDSLAVFETFDNIICCAAGDKGTNTGAKEFCYKLAINNGWHEHLDVSQPFNADLDKIYNPNAIYERASIIFRIIQDRKKMSEINANKLDVISDIVKSYTDNGEQVLIVSKSGDFAIAVAEHLNKINSNTCGQYHDSIPSDVIIGNDGKPIVYKSGDKKGEPRMFGAVSISSLYLKAFNSHDINVLSVKNNSSNGLKIAVSAVILTSAFCDDVNAFIHRFDGVDFVTPYNTFHVIYSIGSSEESKLSNRPFSTNHIIENKISNGDESFDDFVCE